MLAIALIATSLPLKAQWMTQSFNLKPGWNAAYLHLDVSHATLTQLLGENSANSIDEVWLWDPAPSTLQFVQGPQVPSETGSRWLSWSRSTGPTSPLQKLVGNAAYLIRVRDDAGSLVWSIKGKPLPPRYEWTSTGLNFLGFPTPAGQPPSFDAFLAPASGLMQSLEVYAYPGGPLGPNNPVRVFAYRTTSAVRGEAFWMRSEAGFNRYFGPFEVNLESLAGAAFGDSTGQRRLRLRNVASQATSVTLELLPSEDPPAGQPPILQPPPLLLRGERNPTNLTYGLSPLGVGSRISKTLAPRGEVGSEMELVLGVNRAAMDGTPGTLYAGILRLTDSLGLSQVDIAASATVATSAGCWVGEAMIGQVRQNLTEYQRDAQGAPVVSAAGRYVPIGGNTNLGFVGRPFPLRLILHNDQTNTVLLQRAYFGFSRSNAVITTTEAVLDRDSLQLARRITAVHLPWSRSNLPWVFTGEMRVGGQLSATVDLAYDDHASNPFLHTYHPDHDNLDAKFSGAVARGEESYGVRRVLTLKFNVPTGDFVSLTGTGQTLSGDYEESVTLLGKGDDSRRYEVRGAFSLNRISNIPSLTLP